MKKLTKIITASVTAAVICCGAVIATVAVTSASSVPRDDTVRIEKEELHKKMNAPDELKAGKYYYNGDTSSDFWIEISDGYGFEYKSSDMMKAAEMICAQRDEKGTEAYDSAVQGTYELFNAGKTTYAIECVEIGDEVKICVFIGAEPGSNYERHTGPVVYYVDENTLDGGYDANFIYAAD